MHVIHSIGPSSLYCSANRRFHSLNGSEYHSISNAWSVVNLPISFASSGALVRGGVFPETNKLIDRPRVGLLMW